MPLNVKTTPPIKTATPRALVVISNRIKSLSPRLESLSTKLTNHGGHNGLFKLFNQSACIIPLQFVVKLLRLVARSVRGYMRTQ